MEQFFLYDQENKTKKLMKRMFRILTLASLMAAMISCNEARREQEQDSNEVAEEANEEKFEDADKDVEKDADFIAEAVASNYAEIKLAQLAAQRSSNAEVKSIAKMLEADHTKTLNELKAFAQTKAITVPVEEKDDAKRTLENLREEDAKDFDKKWIDEMEDKHEKSINKFENRLDKTEDAELKALVSKTIPHLKMHLEKIKACEEKMDDNKNL
jgi:putative membrane protein